MLTQRRTRTLLATTLLATTVLAAVLVTGACSADGPDDAAGGTVEPARDDAARSEQGRQERGADDAAAADAGDGARDAATSPDPQQRTVIATGTMSLEAEDVAEARFDVQQVLDAHGGTVSHEETGTGDDGELARVRMVLRIPVAKVAEATAALEEVAELTSSTYGEEDVKTQVLDVEARIRAQEKSVRRIEALLSEAEDLSTLVTIEQELTRRQAELDSLTSQQEWLRDQTDLATITVHLERGPATAEDDPERAGFLAGLQDGWASFVGALTGTAAVVGFLLPWLGLLLITGAVARLAWRRTRRTT